MRAHLSLEARPMWQELEPVRKKCHAFLTALHYQAALRESIVMIASELMENAVKYGYFCGNRDKIPLTLSVDRGSIVIEVRSPLDLSPSGTIRNLDCVLKRMRRFQSATDAYLDRLSLVSEKHIEDPQSRMGLARIAYEGNATIDFYVDSDDFLVVCATRKIN